MRRKKINKGVRGLQASVKACLSLRSGHKVFNVCGVRSVFVCGNILRSAVSQEVAELCVSYNFRTKFSG